MKSKGCHFRAAKKIFLNCQSELLGLLFWIQTFEMVFLSRKSCTISFISISKFDKTSISFFYQKTLRLTTSTIKCNGSKWRVIRNFQLNCDSLYIYALKMMRHYLTYYDDVMVYKLLFTLADKIKSEQNYYSISLEVILHQAYLLKYKKKEEKENWFNSFILRK